MCCRPAACATDGRTELTPRDRDRRVIRFEVDDCRAIVVRAVQSDGVEERMELSAIRKR